MNSKNLAVLEPYCENDMKRSHKPPLQVVVWKSPVRATACSPLKGDVTSLLLALL